MDTFRAFLGPKHCDWCVDRPPSWWDRLMRFDQRMVKTERRRYERAALLLTTFWNRVGFWKIGQRWHFRHHEGRYGND